MKKKNPCKKILSTFCLIGLFVSLLTGCGSDKTSKSDSGTAKSSDNTVLNVALASDISSLDPIHNYSLESFCVVNNIAETLLAFDTDGVALKPNLASSWEEVDNLTYVYQLRTDVCFSDGTPMTAEDVVFSMNRTMEPDSAADMEALYENVASIEKTGDSEVTVKLSSPDPLWKYYAATSACQIISQAYYEDNKDSFGTPTGNILATGPYVCKSWKMDSEILLTKNPNYWNKENKIDVETINYYVIGDEASRVLAMSSGQVDMIVSPSVDMVSDLKEIDGVQIKTADSIYVDYVGFNCARKPFDDENLRKACSYAIDASSIRSGIYGEYASDATGMPFGEAVYALDYTTWKESEGKLEVYAYNINKAKEYLAKSAYPKGLDVSLLYYTKNANKNAAVSIQSSLAEIGVNVTLDEVPTGNYWSYVYGSIRDENDIRDYDMILGFWVPDCVDPSGYINIMYGSSGIGRGGCNTASYSNDDVDSLIVKANNAIDGAERSALLVDAMMIASEENPYKLLFYRDSIMAINTKKCDVNFDVMWQYDLFFKDVTIK